MSARAPYRPSIRARRTMAPTGPTAFRKKAGNELRRFETKATHKPINISSIQELRGKAPLRANPVARLRPAFYAGILREWVKSRPSPPVKILPAKAIKPFRINRSLRKNAQTGPCQSHSALWVVCPDPCQTLYHQPFARLEVGNTAKIRQSHRVFHRPVHDAESATKLPNEAVRLLKNQPLNF